MLCQFCQHFDFEETSSKAGSAHHSDWQALCASARAGCAICELVQSRCRSRYLDHSEYQRWDDLKHRQLRCRMYSEGTMVWKLDRFIVAHMPMFTYSHDPLASIISARPIFESVLDPTCVHVMREWLEVCEKNHTYCRSSEQQRLPTRILDVGSETQKPRVVISNGRVGRWVALSHVWEDQIPIKIGEEDLAAQCSEIRLKDLGPKFADAVLITRLLGIQYLWIDSLCILQSCKEHWAAESSNMGHVFRNAALTIAAEASPDSTTGIVRSTASLRSAQSILLSSSCSSKVKNIEGKINFRATGHVPWNEASSRGPLSTRVWALQEEILSPRILRFGKREISWRCCSGVSRESSAEELQISPTLPQDFAISLPERVVHFGKLCRNKDSDPVSELKDYLLSFWYGQVVNNCSGRKFRYETETLVAVHGIVKEIQATVPGLEWEAGLWLSDLHIGLTWSTPADSITRHSRYIAPSWSWASIDFSNSNREKHTIYDSDMETARYWRRFTPIADIGEAIITQRKVDKFDKEIEHWALEMTSQCCTICSCRIPASFFDIDARRSPEFDEGFRLEKIARTRSHDGSLGSSIGLETIMQSVCIEDISGGHESYLYLQIGCWETNRYNQFPIIVTLILKEVKDKAGLVYQRVGRALVPTDSVHDIWWPIETLVVI